MNDKQVYSHSFFSQNKVSIYALYVEETGVQRCFAGQCWGPETREYYQFVQVLSGRGSIRIGKREFGVCPNDVILLYPTDHVSYSSDTAEPLEYTWVGFKGSDAQMLLSQSEFTRPHPLVHVVGDVPFSQNLLNLYESHGNRPQNSVRMIGYLYLYFSELLQNAGLRRMPNDSAQTVIELAIDYIVKNFAEPITLKQLADAVAVSPSWLYRSFIRYMSISPMRYLSEYRIEQSIVLLLNDSMSIGSVAYAVGFHDPFYYSKVFKSMKNCSPTAFRLQNQVSKAEPTGKARDDAK